MRKNDASLEKLDNDAIPEVEKLVAQPRHGKMSAGDGMMSNEIDAVMKRYRPRFLGTIARDQWDVLTAPVESGKSGWIMNTDPLTKPRQHWVAFLMDLDNTSVEYYNSFADDIPGDVLQKLKEFLNEHNGRFTPVTLCCALQNAGIFVNHLLSLKNSRCNCGLFQRGNNWGLNFCFSNCFSFTFLSGDFGLSRDFCL